MRNLKIYYQKWQGLTTSGKLLFCRSIWVLLLVKMGLKFLKFPHFKSIFHWFTKTNEVKVLSESRIIEIADTVDRAANFLPFSLLCLPRALATKYLLKGVTNINLEIGVEITPKDGFQAHAWVEHNNVIIIGDWSDSSFYQRLWKWE